MNAVAGAIFALLAVGASADEHFVLKESVSNEWADVLRVTPITQTVTGSRMQQVCDGKEVEEPAESLPQRWLDNIRSLGKKAKQELPSTRDRLTGNGCRLVRVERKFTRPIGYDVDYMFRGMKFRSRLPEDPGSRLRIRVGVTPVIE